MLAEVNCFKQLSMLSQATFLQYIFYSSSMDMSQQLACVKLIVFRSCSETLLLLVFLFLFVRELCIITCDVNYKGFDFFQRVIALNAFSVNRIQCLPYIMVPSAA